MKICFVDVEPEEEAYYREQLAEHALLFVADLESVPEDTEAACVFIYSPIGARFLDAHPGLRWIASRSGASEHIDLAACQARNVVVSHAPDYGNTTVAEHTFALILALSRRLREVMEMAGEEERFSYSRTRGFDLCGKTLGIIGMGRIASRVTALAHAFQMHVVAWDPERMLPADAAKGRFAWRSFAELLAQSDVISLHARLTPATYHLMDQAAFARCRRGVLIVNTARGRLIDTAALRDALESGLVGGAGLDVLEEERVMREPVSRIIADEIVEHLHADAAPRDAAHHRRLDTLHKLVMSDSLLARRNVVFTPHVAFNSLEAVERLTVTTVQNLRAFARGQPQNVALP